MQSNNFCIPLSVQQCHWNTEVFCYRMSVITSWKYIGVKYGNLTGRVNVQYAAIAIDDRGVCQLVCQSPVRYCDDPLFLRVINQKVPITLTLTVMSLIVGRRNNWLIPSVTRATIYQTAPRCGRYSITVITCNAAVCRCKCEHRRRQTH